MKGENRYYRIKVFEYLMVIWNNKQDIWLHSEDEFLERSKQCRTQK